MSPPPRKFADAGVLDALKALQSQAAKSRISDAEFMKELDIDRDEFRELVGRNPET